MFRGGIRFPEGMSYGWDSKNLQSEQDKCKTTDPSTKMVEAVNQSFSLK